MKKIILLIMISIALISCEKEYLPTANQIETEVEAEIESPVLGEDISLLNIIWVKPNSYVLGGKIEIRDKNNEVVFSELSIIESDSIFRYYPNIILQPEEYKLSLISSSGNIISSYIINISEAFGQDEFIIPLQSSTFYLQMKWEKL